MFEIKHVKYEYEESGNPVALSDDNKLLYQRVEIVGPADSESYQKNDCKTNIEKAQ
jgi:hypothetical protein